MVLDADGGCLVKIKDALCRIDTVEVTSLLNGSKLFLSWKVVTIASLIVGCKG